MLARRPINDCYYYELYLGSTSDVAILISVLFSLIKFQFFLKIRITIFKIFLLTSKIKLMVLSPLLIWPTRLSSSSVFLSSILCFHYHYHHRQHHHHHHHYHQYRNCDYRCYYSQYNYSYHHSIFEESLSICTYWKYSNTGHWLSIEKSVSSNI